MIASCCKVLKISSLDKASISIRFSSNKEVTESLCVLLIGIFSSKTLRLSSRIGGASVSVRVTN